LSVHLHRRVTKWAQAVVEKAEVAVVSGLSGMNRVSGVFSLIFDGAPDAGESQHQLKH